jgi:hypothetical protein
LNTANLNAVAPTMTPSVLPSINKLVQPAVGSAISATSSSFSVQLPVSSQLPIASTQQSKPINLSSDLQVCACELSYSCMFE